MGNSASSKLISAAEDNKIKVVKKILARYTEQQRKLEAGTAGWSVRSQWV
jgi:hypothetical protein